MKKIGLSLEHPQGVRIVGIVGTVGIVRIVGIVGLVGIIGIFGIECYSYLKEQKLNYT